MIDQKPLIKEVNLVVFEGDLTFCKGQVEKTNAMLDWFNHKKALLTNIDESSLIEIQNQFNNIPVKVLGYKTTLELFTKYLESIALQT
jgi:IS30 family transposase